MHPVDPKMSARDTVTLIKSHMGYTMLKMGKIAREGGDGNGSEGPVATPLNRILDFGDSRLVTAELLVSRGATVDHC